MILKTLKLTFKETVTADLPGGSIPVEFKEGKGNLTLFYWEGTLPVKTFTFRFFKKGSTIDPDELVSLKHFGSSIWLNRLWWFSYEEL